MGLTWTGVFKSVYTPNSITSKIFSILCIVGFKRQLLAFIADGFKLKHFMQMVSNLSISCRWFQTLKLWCFMRCKWFQTPNFKHFMLMVSTLSILCKWFQTSKHFIQMVSNIEPQHFMQILRQALKVYKDGLKRQNLSIYTPYRIHVNFRVHRNFPTCSYQTSTSLHQYKKAENRNTKNGFHYNNDH